MSVPKPDAGTSQPVQLEYPMLCIQPAADKGMGVFALRAFKPGETIERAPVVVLPEPQWELLNQTALQHYYYSWEDGTDCLVFGFGAFYNHSRLPNAQFVRHFAEGIMEFVAVRDIRKGEEITIAYGCDLWFEAKN